MSTATSVAKRAYANLNRKIKDGADMDGCLHTDINSGMITIARIVLNLGTSL